MHPCRLILLLAAVILLTAPACADDLPPGDRPAPTPFSRLDDAGTADDHPGASRVVVLDESINTMAPSGVTTVDDYVLTKILTADGCREQSVLSWHYDPQSQWIEVREVNILRDGERLAVDVGAVRDLPAPQAAIYWSDRVKLLQLPRLEVNDGIEVVTWRKGYTYALLDASTQVPDDERFIPPMPGEYFDIVRFVGAAKTLEKRYVLSVPAEKRLHFEVYNGSLYSSATYDEARTEYAWWGFDLPAQVHEPRQPDGSDFVTKVVMATAESWEAKSRWFFDVNRNQFEVTPAIQEKVDEILAEGGLRGADADRKAKALLHWVAQNIRYSGQTMGEGEGFTLHPADMIYEQRSGVCKDIAGMLVTMFRAAGLESNPAMTMAGSRIESVPADQFNHCVTALRLEDGSWRMYDPTWVPYNNAVWSFLETEQHYLVGSDEGETLSRIRYSPPEESPLVARHTAELDEAGTLVGRIRLDGTGALDGRLRGLCNGRRDALVDNWTRLLAHASPRVEAVAVRHRTTDDFSGDMWVEIDYRIPRFARFVDGGLEFESPLSAVLLNDGNLFRGGAAEWDETRETDLLLYFTQLLDGVERIRLPRGWQLVDEPAVEPVDETFGAFRAAAAMDGRTLVLSQRAEVRRRQVPPDGYPGFRAAMEAAREWGSLTFRVEKGDRR
jgi:transglutaminase-like putative cysteine protease